MKSALKTSITSMGYNNFSINSKCLYAQKIFVNNLFIDFKGCERTNVAEQRKVRNEDKIKRPPVVIHDCDNFSISTLFIFFTFYFERLIFRSYFSRPLAKIADIILFVLWRMAWFKTDHYMNVSTTNNEHETKLDHQIRTRVINRV
jgi:hypothetical protein